MLGETMADFEVRTGRKLAGLRGDAREVLDVFLCDREHGFQGTGVGRSAFIKAAVEHFRAMDDEEFSAFVELALKHERDLCVSAGR